MKNSPSHAGLLPILECLLFATDRPLKAEELAGIIGAIKPSAIKKALEKLSEQYNASGHGFYLAEVAGGYQFRTNPRYSDIVKKLRKVKPPRLSRAALETLAIIAYKQPVHRAEIERIRGVDTSGTLRLLLEKDLIRIAGRKKEPGRPILYGTSRKFLEYFNLKDLSCLPSLSEMEDMASSKS